MSRLIEELVLRLPVKSSCRFVALVLARRVPKGKSECWPAIRTIAEETNLSVDTVHDALRTLTKTGYVERRPRFGQRNRQTSNTYVFIVEKMLEAASPSNETTGRATSPDTGPVATDVTVEAPETLHRLGAGEALPHGAEGPPRHGAGGHILNSNRKSKGKGADEAAPPPSVSSSATRRLKEVSTAPEDWLPYGEGVLARLGITTGELGNHSSAESFWKAWWNWERHCDGKRRGLSDPQRSIQLNRCISEGIARSVVVIEVSIEKGSIGTLYWDFDVPRGRQADKAGAVPERELPTGVEALLRNDY